MNDTVMSRWKARAAAAEANRAAITTDPDQRHEKRINAALAAMHLADSTGDRDLAAICWREFVRLVEGRSKGKVRAMETERGLR